MIIAGVSAPVHETLATTMHSVPQEESGGTSAFATRPRLQVNPQLAVRLRLLLVCAAFVFSVQLLRGDLFGSGYERFDKALARHALRVDASQAKSLSTQRQGRTPQSIVFRAFDTPDLGDVWRGEAVLSADGRVAALSELHNLTRTSSADESAPLVMGHFALFSRKIEGHIVGLELLDLSGEARSNQGFLSRVQRGITNLQQTGSWSGIGRRSYALRAPSRRVSMRTEGGRFVVELDGEGAVIDPVIEKPRDGADLFEVRTHATVVAELVPWAVDTVRAIPWVGAEGIAWLENRVFAIRDRVKQAYHSVQSVDEEAEVAQELGVGSQSDKAQEKVDRLAVPNPDSGWPPASIEPLTTPEVAGEGKWRAIVDDPHARELPSGAPVFFQTFLRPDPQRTFARVYLTIWDPRLVQLNMVPGTQEPVSATGETGGGLIPRDRGTMGRLVAAFNGGFQAVHGEFGMMADRRVYLPPKPWAATVAVFDDGRVGMGSWPGPQDRRAGYDEARAVAALPAGMIAFRQNLTSLVEDGRFNPWGRWWWGAAPQQKSEQTLTQRSALCLSREGLMIYGWGDSLSPEALGEALVAARCVRAMHLDMNSGHSGMEFYNVPSPQETAMPVGKRESFRFQGTISGLPGYTVRARKAVTSMGMPLPRYIHPDPRDYFYLTLKPGIETSPVPASAPALSSADLPHAGWPPALARSVSAGSRVLRIDPARAIPTTAPATGAEVLLAELRGKPMTPVFDDHALFSTRAKLGLSYAVGVPVPSANVLLHGQLLSSTTQAESAIGVDREGLLVYAETSAKTAGALHKLLASLGVERAIALDRVRLGLQYHEGLLDAEGTTRMREGTVSLRFVASSVPAAEVLFPDNRPMPYSKWAQLQDQRVRYFRASDPSARAPAGALTEPK